MASNWSSLLMLESLPLPINLKDFSDPFYSYALTYSAIMIASVLALDVYTVRYREGFIAAAIRTIVSYCLLASTTLILRKWASLS